MSLVAYGASDDESDSDNAQDETVYTSIPEELKLHNNEKLLQTAPKSGLAAKLPPPRVKVSVINETETISSSTRANNIPKRSGLASTLPAPKNTSFPKHEAGPLSPTTVDLDNEDDIIEVEEDYVPLSSIKKGKTQAVKQENQQPQSIGSLFSRMPTPWSWQTGISVSKKADSGTEEMMELGGSKQKQPVKIAALAMLGPDSDDEDDGKPAAKKIKQSEGGSGLAALLPKPRHSVTVKANPNKPVSKAENRLLIPHTLTKKPAASSKTAKNANKKSLVRDDSDDDDDNEPVQFFSFNEKSQTNKDSTAKETAKPSTTCELPDATKAVAPVSAPEIPVSIADSNTYADVSSTSRIKGTVDYSSAEGPSSSYGSSGTEKSSSSYTAEHYSGAPVASQGYDTAATAPYYDYQQQPYSGYDQSTAIYTSASSYGCPQPGYDQYYQQPQASGQADYGFSQPVSDQPQTAAEPDKLDMDKLRRIQGKRNRREQINIIDINAADQTGDVELMATKLTSEEVAQRPSKKKGDMPTSQQRRKHQITYLAHQAKEHEFELRQQWASNRQSKRQTQSKYGF